MSAIRAVRSERVCRSVPGAASGSSRSVGAWAVGVRAQQDRVVRVKQVSFADTLMPPERRLQM